MDKKIYLPGKYIPSLSEITSVTEKLNINIADIEILRMHYAYTLDYWYKNTTNNKNKIIEMYDERFFRIWEFIF